LQIKDDIIAPFALFKPIHRWYVYGWIVFFARKLLGLALDTINPESIDLELIDLSCHLSQDFGLGII
jgi:hypothetical protein